MKSAWNQGESSSHEEENNGHVGAAELHDPRGMGMHQGHRRREEKEALEGSRKAKGRHKVAALRSEVQDEVC